MEVSIAVLTQQMIAMAATLARVEALVDNQIVGKRTPWPLMLGSVMLVLTPAAALYGYFSQAIVTLQLMDRDSMNERREMRSDINKLEARLNARDKK